MNEELDLWQEYLDDELPQEACERIAKELAEDPEKQAAFARFKAEYAQGQALFAPIHEGAEAFDVEAQLQRLQPQLHAHADAAAPWFSWAAPMFAAMAGVAALLFVMLPETTKVAQIPDAGSGLPTYLTPKGAALRMLHQHKGDPNSNKTTHGTVLHPGDFVQFAFASSTPQHAMIVSIDATGKISRYVPLDRPQSTKLTTRLGTLPAQESIELDGSLGQELFLMITAEKSFSYQKVKLLIERVFHKNKRSLEGLPKAIAKAPQLKWTRQESMLIHKKAAGTKPAK